MANVLVEEQSLRNIANSIRQKIGSEEKLTPDQMAGAIDSISGGDSGPDFFDVYQNYGNRIEYTSAFSGLGWNLDTFKPKYDIIPMMSEQIFKLCDLNIDLVEKLNELGITLDFSKTRNLNQAFSGSTKITRVGVINLSSIATGISQTFYSNNYIETVDEIIMKESTSFANCLSLNQIFYQVPKLKNLKITGKFKSDPVFNASSLLTGESVASIIEALVDASDQINPQKITFHTTVSNKLTSEQLSVISNKNWELA